MSLPGLIAAELVSLNEPGNEVRPGRELCTSAHQESLETRLAMSLHSVLVLIREVFEQG